MIKKVIKTKAQASKVVNELVKDLEESLNGYGSYKVEKQEDSTDFSVVVTSPHACSIITCSACEDILDVVHAYDMLYKGINYHLETQRWEDEHIPAFVVGIQLA